MRNLGTRAGALAALTLLAPLAPARQDGAGLRELVELYRADRGALERKYDAPLSAAARARLEAFERGWLARLAALPFGELARDAQVDWLLLRNELERRLAELGHQAAREAEARPLLPPVEALVGLLDAQRELAPLDPRAAAELLAAAAAEARAATDALRARESAEVRRTLAERARRQLGRLRGALGEWHRFHLGYDPLYTWWVRRPYEALDAALAAHEELLRARFAGADDADALIGDPIGDAALRDALVFEWLPYTPEELIAIAERELAWCDAEMLRASRAMGYGDDWRAAQDAVKGHFVPPGEQPALIRDLALEAVEFLEARELLTIPELAKETWRMEMMSPERQRTSPYFLGGETIIVSFPTDGMEHDDKLTSLRGNNVHFARATVHHELIPGHHLQQYMTARHRPYRRLFDTPFWVEGWALYWELRLWDLGFARGPEDRVGMLFWRKHRCARIVFSLSFHLGRWSGDECVDYLVERVGHERANAAAEVRRSIAGGYGPLYQCAYLLGGLQLRALWRERVERGGWSERAFHDAVLREGPIPIELVRAALGDAPLAPDQRSEWRFDAP